MMNDKGMTEFPSRAYPMIFWKSLVPDLLMAFLDFTSLSKVYEVPLIEKNG